MRVFVLSIGRSATTSFWKACTHITNYTSAHQTPLDPWPSWPDNHIEVNPYLIWHLDELETDHTKDFYCMLIRPSHDIVRSILRWDPEGKGGIGGWAKLSKQPWPNTITAKNLVRLVDRAIRSFLKTHLEGGGRFSIVYVDDFRDSFKDFLTAIGGQCDLEAAVHEFNQRHNRSRDPS